MRVVKSQNHVKLRKERDMNYYRQDMSTNGAGALGHKLPL